MTGRSGCALEPLFDSGAGYDRIAIAKPQPGSEGSMLVPQAIQSRVDLADVGPYLRVMPVGEPMPELRPLLAQALDLLVDILDGSHGFLNG